MLSFGGKRCYVNSCVVFVFVMYMVWGCFLFVLCVAHLLFAVVVVPVVVVCVSCVLSLCFVCVVFLFLFCFVFVLFAR